MNPRQHVAEARIALRAAKDGHDTAKIIATLDVTGKNPEERKRNTAQALLNDRTYMMAQAHVRACEATLDRAEAAVAEQEHELRIREVAARERLTEMLRGRRVDDAVFDEVAFEEARTKRIDDLYPPPNDDYTKVDSIDWYKQR